MQTEFILSRLAVALLALSLAACAGVKPSAPAQAPADAPDMTAGPSAGDDDDAPARAGRSEHQLQKAMQAAQPRNGNLQRARAQLEALLAATDDDARALHPYARSLLEQINERQRLDLANQKLTQQLERSNQQLKDSQAKADDLQRKLDALADIERSLPASRVPARGVPR